MMLLDSNVCSNSDPAVTHAMSKGATSGLKVFMRDESDVSQKVYYCYYGYR